MRGTIDQRLHEPELLVQLLARLVALGHLAAQVDIPDQRDAQQQRRHTDNLQDDRTIVFPAVDLDRGIGSPAITDHNQFIRRNNRQYLVQNGLQILICTLHGKREPGAIFIDYVVDENLVATHALRIEPGDTQRRNGSDGLAL
ncbi:hypothetical protein D3C81_1139220 [compost metagenome]